MFRVCSRAAVSNEDIYKRQLFSVVKTPDPYMPRHLYAAVSNGERAGAARRGAARRGGGARARPERAEARDPLKPTPRDRRGWSRFEGEILTDVARRSKATPQRDRQSDMRSEEREVLRRDLLAFYSSRLHSSQERPSIPLTELRRFFYILFNPFIAFDCVLLLLP